MKKISSLVILVVSMFVITSCFKKNGLDTIFEDTLIEFDSRSISTSARAYDRVANGVNIKDSVRVNLIGAQRTTAVTATYDVVLVPQAELLKDGITETIADVHFVKGTGTVTIPAGSSFGYVKFEIIDDALQIGKKYSMKFKLTTSTIKIAKNYETITIPFSPLCGYDRNVFVGSFSTVETGYPPVYTVTSAATAGNPNGITITNFWDDGGVINYVLDGATATLSIPNQTSTTNTSGVITVFSTPSTTSSINFCTGRMVSPFTVVGFTPQTHTYTKL